MKIQNYIVGAMLALTVFACNKEDDLVAGKVDFSSPYVIENDPNDPIQHRRYEIYEKYGVPVFFNDTVSATLLRYDNNGNPVYQYETLDLNWNFTSHTAGDIAYTYTYLDTPEEQNEALNFVETFLSIAGESMRPFCIFAVAKLDSKSESEEEQPEYLQNFRMLVISDILETEDDQVETRCREMINAMVLDKVKQNSSVVARFGSVSSTENWYERPWVNENGNGGLGCDSPFFLDYTYLSIGLNDLYADDWITIWEDETGYWGYPRDVLLAYRTEVLTEIGQFGFICGDKNFSSGGSPTADYDLEYYVNEIMACRTREVFLERYGMSPLVVEKFEILADFIENDLGVEL